MSVVMEETAIELKSNRWLCDIPSHWEVRRNGRLFRELKLSGTEDLPILTVSLHDGVTVRDMSDENHRQMIEDKTKYKRVEQGDIAYNMMRMWQGAVGVAPAAGLVSPAYVTARPYSDVNARYYEYLFRTSIYMGEVEGYSRGIVSDRNRLYWEEFKQIPTPYPPRAEQDAIVAFLDRKLEEIDRFIANKRRLIKLLEEKQSLSITRAVTTSSDSDDELRAIDLPWLTSVPARWNLTRLKYVATVQTGLTLGKDYTGSDVVARPYLRVANVQDGHLELANIKRISIPATSAVGCELQEGDVLMTEGGDIDKLGRGAIWTGEVDGCLHQNHIFAVRTSRNKLLPEYLALVMRSTHGRFYFWHTATRTTNLASTNSTTLKAFPLFLPDVNEQRGILHKLDAKNLESNKAISRVDSEIKLMNEFRTSLIAEAVTGKIRITE